MMRADRPRRGRRVGGRGIGPSLALWLALALLLWLDHALPHATVEIRGAFIGAIIAAIGQAFAWLAQQAVTIAITVAQAAVMIATAIAHFAVAVGHVFLKVWNFTGKFWSTTLKPFIQWTWAQIQRFERWLQATFKPVLAFLQAVRREFLKIYEKWFAPIFTTIDTVRRMLRILATFHLQWARDLDRKLAELEARLLAPITFVMRTLNEAMNVINRIVTLDGLFQRLTLLASMLTYERDVWKVWWTSVHRRELENAKVYGPPAPDYTADQAVADMTAYLLRDEGPDKPIIDEHVRDLKLRLRAAGL